MISKSRHHKQKLGQYFTPPALAGAIWELVALFRSKGRSRVPRVAGPILEPSVGTGVFLTEGHRRGLAADAMWGVDLDATLEEAWRHLGRTLPGLTLVAADALCPHPELERSFEVVIGNPPYGSDGLYALREPEQSPELAQALAAYTIYRHQGRHKSLRQLATYPIECLFIERSVSLCAPGGWIALILPEGLVTNRRLQHVRDWAAERCAIRAVVSLPEGAFRSEQASARTVLLLMQKRGTPGTTFMDQGQDTDLEDVLERAEAFLMGRPSDPTALVPEAQLVGERWDPAYWSPELRAPLLSLTARHKTRPLGDFLSLVTYGPVVTGRGPDAHPGEVWLLNQGELGVSGIDLSSARQVASDSVFDPPRSRPRVGDLLFARSGAGSLGKGKMAILSEPLRANVGCFVDILRLEGLDPYFAWLFLASRFGQGQIRRLINGVATPNLSFDEIRSLRVPVLSEAVQAEFAACYRERVLPRHRSFQAMALDDPGRTSAKAAAAAAMRQLIGHLEDRLSLD